MELGIIRSRFIQNQLRRALCTSEDSFAWRALEDIRHYFHWFADSIPEPDRQSILRQLGLLEEKCRTNRSALLTVY